MNNDDMTVIVPKGMIPHDDLLSELIEIGLRLIAQKCGEEENCPEKYGADFDNEVFSMHPFCWCDEDECKYCGYDRLPNFVHKNSGLTVHWYKYIGRGMEISGNVDINKVLNMIQECLDSID